MGLPLGIVEFERYEGKPAVAFADLELLQVKFDIRAEEVGRKPRSGNG